MNRTVPSGSVTSLAGHRSGGNDASIALMYCGECQLHSLRFMWAGDSITRQIAGATFADRSPMQRA